MNTFNVVSAASAAVFAEPWFRLSNPLTALPELKRVAGLIRDAEVPLVIPFPGKEANTWKVEDRLDYVASLIRSAIGYHIKLTR